MPSRPHFIALDQRGPGRAGAAGARRQAELIVTPSLRRELHRDKTGLSARPLPEQPHMGFEAGPHAGFIVVGRQMLPGFGHALILRMDEGQRPAADDTARAHTVFVLVDIGVLRKVDDAYPGGVRLVVGGGEVMGLWEKLAAGKQWQDQQAERGANRHGASPLQRCATDRKKTGAFRSRRKVGQIAVVPAISISATTSPTASGLVRGNKGAAHHY